MDSQASFSNLDMQSQYHVCFNEVGDSNKAEIFDERKVGEEDLEKEMISCDEQNLSVQIFVNSKYNEQKEKDDINQLVLEDNSAKEENERNNIIVDLGEKGEHSSLRNGPENHVNDAQKQEMNPSILGLNSQSNQALSQQSLTLANYSKFVLKLYAKAILYMIPFLLFILAVYLPMQFITINNQTGLIYITTNNILGGLFYFIVTWTASYFVFDLLSVFPIVKRVGIPCQICNTLSVLIRNVIVRTNLLTIAAYIACLVHHYWFFLSISRLGKKSVEQLKPLSREENKHCELSRGQKLSTDGTPMMFVKSFYVFLVFYFISMSFFVAYSLQPGTSISVRIGIRLLIVPFILSLSEHIQTVMTRRSSTDHIEHRFIQLRITSLIHIVALRFMVTNSKNIEEVAIITIISCLFEMMLRITCMKRFYMARIVINFLTKKLYRLIDARFKYINHTAATQARRNPPIINTFVNSSAPITGRKLGIFESFNSSFDQWSLTEEAKLVQSLFIYQERKNIQNEIQAIIALSLVSYLLDPIRDYVLFRTTSSIWDLLSSVGLQVLIEFITDTTCQWIRKDPIPDVDYYSKRMIWRALHNLPYLAVAIFFPISSFMKVPENFSQ